MKTALITGASSGIGKEMAYLFAKDKIQLALVARNSDALHAIAYDLKRTYQVEVAILPYDLSLPDAALNIHNKVQALGMTIDYLVNNAGFGDSGDFLDTDWTKERQMIGVNITALTQFTKLFSQDMIKLGGGRILNVASTAAFQPGPLMAVYYATKAYVLQVIRYRMQSIGIPGH